MVKIFVGRLQESVEKGDLENLFKEYGEVTDCSVLKNYGFVHMANLEEAKAAINGLDKHNLKGNAINVELSTTKVTKTSKLFVGNLPEGTKSSDIHKLFKKYGTVIECDVLRNFAFVHMSRESMAQSAIDGLNNTMFNDSKITVQMGRNNRQNDNGPPGYHPGGRGGMGPGPFRGRGGPRGMRGGFMPRGGPPPYHRFPPRRPFGDNGGFADSPPPFARGRGFPRPRMPMQRRGGYGGVYDEMFARAGVPRRPDPVLAEKYLREREALSGRYDAEVFADAYSGLTAQDRYDFSGDYLGAVPTRPSITERLAQTAYGSASQLDYALDEFGLY